MIRKLIFLAAAAVIQPAVAFAQAPGSQPGPSLTTLSLKCSDFQKNEDGTWSPTHTLTIPAGGTRFSLMKKDIVGPTTSVAGYPLGSMVNSQCGAH